MNYGLTTAIIGFTIMLLVSVFFGMKVGKKSLQPKDIPNGIPATATVISSRQGNMKMTMGGVQEFYQLIIEVNITDKYGQKWPARIKEMVPLTEVGIFQPGVQFKVKYDPNDKSNVIIDRTKE